MTNPRLATRYAKSLVDLAIEQNQLDAICNDMKLIKKICKSNPDFTAVLRSPVINADKKAKIIQAITKQQVSTLTTAFIDLLVRKSRENNLPEIAEAFVTQYNTINNIHKVKITTAVAMSDEIKNAIISKIKSTSAINKIELETSVKENLIGGFVLETAGNLVDASILRDLKDVQKQFLNNDYIHKIR